MAGLDFHLIDAELERHYFTSLELENILSIAEELESNLTTIMTINARHRPALLALKDYANVISQHGNAGLCIVAGNPSYLTGKERRLDPKSRVTELVRASRNALPSAPIFVGSEGLQELASELALECSAVPFMLLGRSTEDPASGLRFDGNEPAVYCPSDLLSEEDGELIKSFGQYALRRRWVREMLRSEGLEVSEVRAEISNGGRMQTPARHVLAEAIHSLALSGNVRTHARLRELSQKGVKYVAFLLAEESADQNERLSKLAGIFREEGVDGS
jgi:hypothetical protein